MNTTVKIKRTSLTMPARLKFAALIEAEYTASGLRAAEFAALAAAKLGEPINENHLAYMLASLGIQTNHQRALPPAPLDQRLDVLGAELKGLALTLETLARRVTALERFEFARAEPKPALPGAATGH
jgi:hypothetical protein